MAEVVLKANPFIPFHILQYSSGFRHLSLKNKFPEKHFLRDGGNSKDLSRNSIQQPENIQSGFVLSQSIVA